MAQPLELPGLAEWLVERGLRGLSLADQLDGFCQRLVEAGFPARRFNMSMGTLHPRHGAHSYVWSDGSLARESYPRQRNADEEDGYLRSPIYHLRSTGEARLRRRLDTGAPDDFPVLADLRAGGMTDYAARLVRFASPHHPPDGAAALVEERGRPDPLQGIFFSCATDVPEGFDEVHLLQVAELLPYLALAVKSRSTFDVARTLLETYLGRDAGWRVLTGDIDRHSVRTIQAVIWLCDLRGFSSIATRVSPGELVEILDGYLELMARPVLDNGGQILKFLGDGFLATFDLSERDRESACAQALTAAEQLIGAFPRFNRGRRAAGRSSLDFGVALHIGEVLYGNIGAMERLDFTVVGSAVNEASRIERLCRPLRRHVLVSSTFHDAAPSYAGRMVSIGFHGLRGIGGPRELFTIVDS